MADEIDGEILARVRKLHKQMVDRRPVIEKLAQYRDGRHNLAFSGEEFLRAFGGMFHAFADNWCGVVVDAVDERMAITGFRVGDNPKTDDNAHRFWELNEMGLQSQMGHTDGLTVGGFYVTTWAGDTDGVPEITVDSAASTIVEHHPKMPRRRTAGLRTWMDDDGFEHAELFLPGEVYCVRSKSKRTADLVQPERSHWVVDDHPDVVDKIDESGRMPNPLGVVPIVSFVNRRRLYISRRVGWAAHSEIAQIVPLQDMTNKLMADLIVASEFGAFPQRNLTGYTPDEDEETGETIQPKFESGAGKVWWLEDVEAKWGQFEATDLANIVSAVELVVQHIASISATPPHYLRASADRLSGESLKSAETGLVSKVRRKMEHWSSGWEEVMRLAGKVANVETLAGADMMETVWRDPETRTEAEHIDALGKKAQLLGVPAPQLWEEAGYSPQQIKRFPAMMAQLELQTMAAAAARSIDTGTEPPAPDPTQV